MTLRPGPDAEPQGLRGVAHQAAVGLHRPTVLVGGRGQLAEKRKKKETRGRTRDSQSKRYEDVGVNFMDTYIRVRPFFKVPFLGLV